MQNWKKGCVFGHIDKFWKEHHGQIKKNACKNAYLGSFFIPKKYMIRVLFVSPWTSLIPLLPFEWPPGAPFVATMALSLVFHIKEVVIWQKQKKWIKHLISFSNYSLWIFSLKLQFHHQILTFYPLFQGTRQKDTINQASQYKNDLLCYLLRSNNLVEFVKKTRLIQ